MREGMREDGAVTILIILGPPGSGKSTQAALLAKRFGIPGITASEVLTETAEHSL